MPVPSTEKTILFAAVPMTKSLPSLVGRSENWDSVLLGNESNRVLQKRLNGIRYFEPSWWKVAKWMSAAILAGLLLGLAMSVVALTPDIVGSKQQFRYVPSTKATGSAVPYIPSAVQKEKLIIQQNNQCWIGIPGATCDPKIRTYV